MTTKEIENRQAQSAMEYETALQMRKLLDEAKKQYKALGGDWDGDDIESRISELVFSE